MRSRSLTKEGKIMHYTSGRTIRELVQVTNELGILREDVVGIFKDREKYYLVYYYGGLDEHIED